MTLNESTILPPRSNFWGPTFKAAIVAEARTWIGTPYHYRAAVKGVGADCVGLINGLWSFATGQPLRPMPAYSSDFADDRSNERMLAAAARHLHRVEPPGAPGDVVLFRWRNAQAVKHAAILATDRTMIHAAEDGGVCEVSIEAWRRGKHIAAVFAFPDPEIAP